MNDNFFIQLRYAIRQNDEMKIIDKMEFHFKIIKICLQQIKNAAI